MVQVTRDVVEEFADDNVKYLELRTTPRDVPATRMTKSSYIASVVAAINAAVSSEKDIIVRLLLAFDRRMSVADIDETLKLAEFYASQSDSVVVGLDLSGDPVVCICFDCCSYSHYQLHLHGFVTTQHYQCGCY